VNLSLPIHSSVSRLPFRCLRGFAVHLARPARSIPHSASRTPHSRSAFTLIELLVVISIIIILMALLFPAFRGAQTQAKRTQAKNDLTQLVTAINAYYTEYGKYPLPAGGQGQNEDYTYAYDGSNSPPNSDLILILQNDTSKSADNPKGVVFFTGPIAKTVGGYGIQPAGGLNSSAFFDPWGKAYSICIDSDYNNKVRERGTGNLLTLGVITWSLGETGDWDKSGIASWK
jgi:prepilin-type N-terminal cleavage/methylation domain-containing protein